MAKGKKEPPSKKEAEKKVNKIVEDKTFGVSFKKRQWEREPALKVIQVATAMCSFL
jgi:hypothetical protein